MDVTLSARLGISALGDVEKFLEAAQHLKALTVQREQRRCRRSRLELSLDQQITTFTQYCGALVAKSPRLADLWKQTQDELSTLTANPDAAAAATGAGCSAGSRGSGTNTRSSD